MKISKFSELVNRILSNNHSHRRDMDVTIVVHSPGSIGSTPSVEVQSIHAGFDWDSGKVLIFPSQPLTTLTPEQITDITDSVRKGQSWHAYQEYKKHQEQLEKLSIELDAAKQRIAELEGMKWFTEFGHLNRGDMLTSEQHRCHNEKKKFQRRV